MAWIRRFILFHGKRHPVEMGAPEVTAFLTALAVERRVAASTQNQALGALLFLYRDVLQMEVPWIDGVVRTRQPQRRPVVLTRDEVRAVLTAMAGTPRLMAQLLYGAGLRLVECCCLRDEELNVAKCEKLAPFGRPAVPSGVGMTSRAHTVSPRPSWAGRLLRT